MCDDLDRGRATKTLHHIRWAIVALVWPVIIIRRPVLGSSETIAISESLLAVLMVYRSDFGSSRTSNRRLHPYLMSVCWSLSLLYLSLAAFLHSSRSEQFC